MARPTQESIDTFIGITGLSETLAVQILQEHEGDLNLAVNAHFNERDQAFARGTSAVPPQDDFMDIDEPVLVDANETSRNLNLPSSRDPDFHGSFFDMPAPFASLTTERRVIPFEEGNETGLSSQSGLPPTIEDVTGRSHVHVPEARGTIIVDDEAVHVPSAHSVQDSCRPAPSAPPLSSVQEPDLDIEEEMIRAVIEASKREAEGLYSNEQFGFHSGMGLDSEKAETNSLVEEQLPMPFSQNGRLETESSFAHGHAELLGNNSLHRQRTRHLPSGSVDSSTEIGDDAVSPPSSPGIRQPNNTCIPQVQPNGNGFPADEWGGISSAEHDEAVMLEAAMFGGVPETHEYNAFSTRRIMQSNLNESLGPYVMPEPRPSSPNLTAQRLIREQQDDEYLASLQADIEKAEARRLEEEAAREAAREEQNRKEEEGLRRIEEEQELERQLAAKEASIPQEPSPDDVTAVNLLVRMPDGSRRSRRFLKSDRLKSLFDYIDIGGIVKPNTYRLVRPYPRRAFGDGDNIMTLSELGLTSKQEALYLELV